MNSHQSPWSFSDKEREEGCTHRVGNLPLERLSKYTMSCGPSSSSGCSLLKGRVFPSTVHQWSSGVKALYDPAGKQSERSCSELKQAGEEAFGSVKRIVPLSFLVINLRS